jgi:hypothetical protein
MARTQRRKQAADREFREHVLGATLSLGLLGAVWWGFKHPEHVSSCATSGPSSRALTRCTSHTLTAVAIHWALIATVGFAVGVVVAVAIISLGSWANRA